MAYITPPPEQYEPIINKTVYGNVLDKIDNYQYNAKLYMIPPNSSNPNSANGGVFQAANDARADTNTESAAIQTGSGGYINGATTASPGETVILAQTGVTGTQIDNIEIRSALGPGNSIHTSEVNFDILQPGAADFLDQIMAAKAYLKDRVFSNDVPLFLEITFKGYNADYKNEDNGGQPVTVAGPFRYKVIVKQVSLEITDEGSTYSFKCIAVDASAYADQFYRMPKKMESVGATIDEHIQDLVQKLNNYTLENYNDYQIQDEVDIDFSGLTSGPYALTDNSITTPDQLRAEEINRIMNPELEGVDEDEYRDILIEAPKDEGGTDIQPGQTRITVREGVTIDRYIATLLSMNDEFFSRLTRSESPNDLGNLKVDKSKPFIQWFKVNTGVKYLAYDKRRKVYAKKVIFKPVIYNTAKTTVQARTEENTDLPADAVESRVNALNVLKAYNYFYTGINDQIINCKIEYNAGVAILSAPTGGASGDFSTNLSKTLATTATTTDDLTGNDLATEAIIAATQGNLTNFFDSLLSNPEREGDVTNFATQVLGFNANEAQDILQNRTGLNSQLFKNALSDRRIAEAARDAQIQSQGTTSDTSRNLDGTTYTPTLSGYVYAPDILGSVSERLDAAAAEEYAVNATQEARAAAEDSDVSPEHSIQAQYVANQAEDATYNGTPRNTIFGYLMQQHAATDFLIRMDLEIKGDPWYLGKPDTENSVDPEKPGQDDVKEVNNSNSQNVSFSGNDNYVLFNMQTPRRYDFNVENEDDNTGYWSSEGTAYFITGIYFVRSVTNMFSQGSFTQEINLIKEPSLQLNRMIKEAEETTDE